MKIAFQSILALVILMSLGAACARVNGSGKKPIRVLLVGGGSSHDFNRWYKTEDVATLQQDGLATVEYTDDPSAVLSKLPQVDVLFLSNNQPIKDVATREAIFAFAEAGKGLVLAHPALWYNWADWPEYNRQLVGGGSKGHNKYGPFEVTVSKKHPVTKGVPSSFTLNDELYYYKADPTGTPLDILATAKATSAPDVFPSIFIVKHPKARIVGIALGHDAASHTLDAYKTILRNSVKWAAGK